MSRVFCGKCKRIMSLFVSAAVIMGSMDISTLRAQAQEVQAADYADENLEVTEDVMPETDVEAAGVIVDENPDAAGQMQAEQSSVTEEPQIESQQEMVKTYSALEENELDGSAVQADDSGDTTPTGPQKVVISGIEVPSRTYDGQPAAVAGTLKAVVPQTASASGREEDVTDLISFKYDIIGTTTDKDNSEYKFQNNLVMDGSIKNKMPVDAGTYTLTIEPVDTNYKGSLSIQFTIRKRTIIVKVNDRQKKIGEAAPSFDNPTENIDYTVSNLVNGDKLTTPPTLAYEIENETDQNQPGATYLITASGAVATPNYDIEYQWGTLTVSGKEEAVISGVTIPNKVYDGKPIEFDSTTIKVTDRTSGKAIADTDLKMECSIYGKQNDGKQYLWDANGQKADSGDDSSDSGDSSKENALPTEAGDYTLRVAVSSTKYRGDLIIEFSITRRPVTLKANDLKIKQGDKIPTEFTYTVEGLLGEDKITTPPRYTCDISDTEKIDEYPIRPRGASAGANYRIDYVPGTLTVVEKDQITISGITTTPYPKIYDGTPAMCNTDKLKVMLNQSGEESKDITAQVDITYSIEGTMANGNAYLPRDIKDGMPTEAGEYTITVTAASKLGEAVEYWGSTEYLFSISPRPLVIVVEDKTIETEDKIPDQSDFSYRIAGMGLLEGHELRKTPIITCDIPNTDTEETYPIVAADADAGSNYSITYRNGTLTVVQKKIVPTRELLRIIPLEPVINVENGTSIDKIEMPETVTIVTRDIGAEVSETTEKTETAAVTWDRVATEGTSYNARKEEEQTFIMGGSVVLPPEVTNISDEGEKSLEVKVRVNVREKYAVRDKVAIPTANIATGSGVRRGTAISLSCETEGAEIYYTLDSSQPDRGSDRYTLYNNPIEVKVNGFTVIWAYAHKEGQPDSDTVKFYYYIKSQAEGEDDEPEVPKEDIPSDGIIPEGLWMTEVSEYTYTGKAIKPEVRVYDYKTRLEEKKDYTIKYANNTKAANRNASKAPSIIITGKGNYEGKVTRTFTIAPKNIGDSDISVDAVTVAYNSKKAQKPAPAVIWNGKKLAAKKDYVVRDANNQEASYKDVGEYTLTVSGLGNYTGEKTFKFTITDKVLASKFTVAKIPDQTYTGKPIEPSVTVKEKSKVLTLGKDYRIDYNIGDHTNVGTATVAVIGMGDYAGTKKVTFKITGHGVLNKAKADLRFVNAPVYTGRAITADQETVTLNVKSDGVTVERTLKKGTDYVVEYINNVKVGTATAVFTGKGAYSGTIKKTFKITPYDISKVSISLNKSYSYVKGGCKPEPIVKFSGKTLKAGTDYTLAYKQNSAAGSQAVLTIKGKGNFNGSVTREYEITAQDIGKMTVIAADKVYQNKKNIYKTTVQLTDTNGKRLAAGKDYDNKNMVYTYAERTLINKAYKKAGDPVDVNDIIPAGTKLNVTITAKGRDYTGTAQGTYRITTSSIAKAKVSIKDQTYTGKAIKLDTTADPQVIYVEVNGTPLKPEEFEIVESTYSNNVNKGKAKVTIRGLGNYGGTKTVTFKIKGKGLGLFGL